MSKTFIAKYDGRCGDCGGDIEAGVDEVTFIEGDLTHVICLGDTAPAAEICRRCFIAMPVTGVCDCDD